MNESSKVCLVAQKELPMPNIMLVLRLSRRAECTQLFASLAGSPSAGGNPHAGHPAVKFSNMVMTLKLLSQTLTCTPSQKKP